MEPNASDATARELMLDFAAATGLTAAAKEPRRYLWTDAFAVCNFLGLYRRTGDGTWRDLAESLVDQVHRILGRHRDDDLRVGWISGLAEEEGELHPTRWGLRIGKPLSERRPGDPPNERLEWDRDGQYYHYLTKWMHALCRMGRATGDRRYVAWALELAQAAHSRFVWVHPGDGRKRIYWKMSIDLRRPLVLAMGQHDPLDGLVTLCDLKAAAGEAASSVWPGVVEAIADLARICREEAEWVTEDPLGIGGLLFDARRIAELEATGHFVDAALLEGVLDAALAGLRSFAADNPLKYRARQRLAFRELGLAIGLKGVGALKRCIGGNPQVFGDGGAVTQQVEALAEYVPFAGLIERFWLDGRNREGESWTEHRDINMVMLATSIAPEEFLRVDDR
ncbi:MAG TPA: hypothetical protein VF799_10460 [Geobacteraceae bacterium]